VRSWSDARPRAISMPQRQTCSAAGVRNGGRRAWGSKSDALSALVTYNLAEPLITGHHQQPTPSLLYPSLVSFISETPLWSSGHLQHGFSCIQTEQTPDNAHVPTARNSPQQILIAITSDAMRWAIRRCQTIASSLRALRIPSALPVVRRQKHT